jgi:uncharacterized membrane protein
MAEKAKVEKVEKTFTGLDFVGETILVYLIPVLGFIFSFMDEKKYSKRAKFLYNQAGAAFIIEMGLVLLGFIPFIRWFFYIVHIVLYVFLVIALIKESQGVQFKIPFISDLAGMIWSKKEEK